MDERIDRLTKQFFGEEPIVATFVPGGGVMITLAEVAEEQAEEEADNERPDPCGD